MSMEIYAFSDSQLNSLAEWQKAIDASGFALSLSSDRPFVALSGFMPVKLKGALTGFECDHWQVRDVQEAYVDISFGHQWRYCIAFRWGIDLKACLGAYIAAAAYANATSGVVLDCEQGELLNGKDALRAAHDIERQLPALEQALNAAMEKYNPSH